jgi:hypothetical protein
VNPQTGCIRDENMENGRMNKTATGKKIIRNQRGSRTAVPAEIYTKKRLAEFAENNEKALAGLRLKK